MDRTQTSEQHPRVLGLFSRPTHRLSVSDRVADASDKAKVPAWWGVGIRGSVVRSV